jgi:hypothetical protein
VAQQVAPTGKCAQPHQGHCRQDHGAISAAAAQLRSAAAPGYYPPQAPPVYALRPPKPMESTSEEASEEAKDQSEHD